MVTSAALSESRGGAACAPLAGALPLAWPVVLSRAGLVLMAWPTW